MFEKGKKRFSPLDTSISPSLRLSPFARIARSSSSSRSALIKAPKAIR